MRIAPELAWQLVDGEAVVIDVPRRNMLGLSPTASFIWARINSESEDEIAAELAREFEVDEARARADVSAFLELMRARGYLVAS